MDKHLRIKFRTEQENKYREYESMLSEEMIVVCQFTSNFTAEPHHTAW